ncbi:EAL domain-containing protein [Qipengyuania sp.]|uniref:sensor domain-containing phosphodiesterase n=1 Tax=Qipengyuania sp. TaxID=2004515 RepID=UPI0035C84154
MIHEQSTFGRLAVTATRLAPVSDQSVDRILSAVRDHLGAEIAFVSRYVDGGMKQLTHVNSDLDLPMGPGFADPREDSYCWHIAEGRLPELIQDVADYPFTQTMAITNFLPVGCHLNTPLRLSDGTLYGSFCCLSRKPDRSMTERDLGVLRAFAALAVEQIEKSLEGDGRRDLLEIAVDGILAQEGIAIYHQPIVSLTDGRQVGAECLARFPDASQRGPDMWFNEAAEIGRGVELELLAVRKAMASAAHAAPGTYVSVNVSPDSVMSGLLEPMLAGYTRHNLVIELTEHQMVADFAALRDALARLAPHARIAIDDVGAGYAGLRHLVDLRPDLLKLDMGLTRHVHADPARRALAGAMVQFAEDIGCSLVAEGIENEDERRALADLGVTYGQGYLFGRPFPAAKGS